jgi:RNA polymerase sigma factor (sigma-70 family)
MAMIEPAALGEWFRAYGAALVLYARQWLDRAAAEDMVQDVFLRLMTQPAAPDNPRAWLFRAVRNAAISGLRSQKRRDAREARPSTERQPWFEPNADERIDAAAAQAVLAGLPQEQREVVVLRIWGELTLREVGELLNEPVSTVFSRYQAALTAIRQRLERQQELNHA